MLVMGIDDAGRGPLIGPMFLAGVLLKEKDELELKHEGVADSKSLKHPERIKLSGMIKDSSVSYHIVETSASDIDLALSKGINLNTLEALKAAEIINKLCVGHKQIKVIVDCPSVNIKAWQGTLLQYLDRQDLDLHCEHKADVNHPAVSAASILAKVAREEVVAKLKKEYGEIGSGYPSDPTTIAFLKKYGQKYKDSGIFRKSWSTWKALFSEADQKTLSGF